jgi:hypothetical protein
MSNRHNYSNIRGLEKQYVTAAEDLELLHLEKLNENRKI